MRNKTIDTMEACFKAGEDYVRNVLKSEPLSPYRMFKTLPLGKLWEQYVLVNTPTLALADSILMMPNWSLSNGCKMEYFHAKGSNKKIYFYPTKKQ